MEFIPMKKVLTERQSQVLDFIKDYHRGNLRSPTIREIGAHFAITNNGVVGHLTALKDKRVIKILPRSRGIIVLDVGAHDVVETVWGCFTVGNEPSLSGSRDYNRLMYKERRLELIDEMGGVCVECDERDPDLLEFHHKHERTWTCRDKNRWTRLAIYKREWAAGKIELLCASCNKKAGKPAPAVCAGGGDEW
jgi:hypothetical protein